MPQHRVYLHVKNAEGKIAMSNLQNKSTGMYTADFFFEAGKILLQLAKRNQVPFLIAALEVDDFDQIKEKYGSKLAYTVLEMTAKLIGENFRTSDLVADMEDGQIGIIFYNTTNVNTKIALDGLRQKIEKQKYLLNNGDKINVTVSIGGVVMHHNLMGARTVEELFEQAKLGVNIAKEQGKNRVIVY